MKLTTLMICAAFAASGTAMVACSASNDVGNTADASTDTGSKPDTNVVGKDSGTTPVACGPTDTNDAALLAATKPTKAAQRGACSSADLAGVKAVFANSAATFADVSKAFTGTCRACAITDLKVGSEGDAKEWAAFLIASTAGDGADVKGGFSNTYGACGFGKGVPAACARRLSEFEQCNSVVCGKCTGTDATACQSEAYASGGICQTAPDLNANCSKSDLALLASCGKVGAETTADVIVKRIAALCGAATAGDAGADAADGQ